MKIESDHDAANKRRWKIVRLDDYTDVAGEIITADEDTGECCLQITANGTTETKSMNFGPRGMKIISRSK